MGSIALELLSLGLIASLGYVGYWYLTNAEKPVIGLDPAVRTIRRAVGMAMLVLGIIVFILIWVFWK